MWVQNLKFEKLLGFISRAGDVNFLTQVGKKFNWQINFLVTEEESR